jgi:ribonuclease D
VFDGVKVIAVDTEAMGLINRRDRLCVVQLSSGDGNAHLVHFPAGSDYAAPNLKKLLSNPEVLKLYHFARFDISIMQQYLGIMAAPLYCTRTASRLVRTFTERHGLKDLLRDLLGREISKQQQSSDWGADSLSPEQQEYAAGDVLHLHALKEKLDVLLAREGRTELAQACFDFLPARALLDLAGWEEVDLLAHS